MYRKLAKFLHVAVLTISLLVSSAGRSPAQENLPAVRLEVLGAPRPVIDWNANRCSVQDIPDAGLRAYRRPDHTIVAFATHYENHRLVGPNFAELRKRCELIYQGGRNPDPSAHDDQTWITATWTDDGDTVAAIGHNEYHGEHHTGMCHSRSPRQCRYGVLSLLISRDGGASFVRSTKKPIAAVPVRQAKDQKRETGFFQPSNIVEHNGRKYVFVRTSGGGAQQPATCLMRASNPTDSASWEIFDGQRFHPALFDPYVDPAHARPTCAQIPGLHGLVWSVLKHWRRGVFVSLMTILNPTTKETYLVTSTSKDLLRWSSPRRVDQIRLDWKKTCGPEPMLHYPSLLDPTSPARNFDTTEDLPLLFLSRFPRKNCKITMERDLIMLNTRLVFEQ
jgi:hypothetical protein